MRDHVVQLVQDWGRLAKPTREDYLKGAQMLDHLRRQSGEGGLWSRPPLMMTATLDDGWGHGLDVIESLAAAVGVTISPLGLLQPPATILKACREAQPDLLGLTVLQFDSDDALKKITAALPPITTVIAGGAAFRYDPEFAERTGTHAVARDGAAFLRFLLAYQPIARSTGMTSCHEA
jgi:methylmalonyl-CoA mutase cobalamin-binding subunit